jgi:type IV pilus assembly protein PilN
MIKINLVRGEGRAAVRGAAAAPDSMSAGGSSNLNGLLVVGCLLAGMAIGGVYWFTKKSQLEERIVQVAAKQKEADSLESIIREVDEFQKRKESLESRIELINDLKRTQKNPVRILDRISSDLPDLVWLDSMSLEAGQLKIAGRALNPNAVANFVTNIKSDGLFDEPKVDSVSQEGAGGLNVYKYSMQVNLKQQVPVQDEDAVEGAQDTASGVE